MKELTKKQELVLKAIKEFIDFNGYSPSIRELCQLCGVSSPATIFVHLKKLKQQYNKKFYSHCVKSLSCEEVCPMGIETQRAISKMNKKAVWILRQFFNRD